MHGLKKRWYWCLLTSGILQPRCLIAEVYDNNEHKYGLLFKNNSALLELIIRLRWPPRNKRTSYLTTTLFYQCRGKNRYIWKNQSFGWCRAERINLRSKVALWIEHLGERCKWCDFSNQKKEWRLFTDKETCSFKKDITIAKLFIHHVHDITTQLILAVFWHIYTFLFQENKSED
jgi:hypothetical protein